MKKLIIYIVILLFLLILVLYLATSDFKKAKPSIYHNAQILTMDEGQPDATTMVVKDGMVVAIGQDDLLTDTRYADYIRKDIKGQTILPGFIDPHTHMALTISLENMIDLSGFTHKTNEEVWSHFEQEVSKANDGDWVICKGIDPVLIPEINLPTIQYLDSIAPNNPVFIAAQSLHSYWANSAAFKQVGIDANTVVPHEESYYEKDSLNQLTGLIVEQAAVLPILELLEDELYTTELLVSTSLEVMKNYASSGNTTIVTTGLSITDGKPMPFFRHLSDRAISGTGRLLTLLGFFPKREALPRHFIYMRHDREQLMPTKPNVTNDFFAIIGIKHWYDGSPYIGSMYLDKPYLDNEFNQEKLDIPKAHRGKNLIESKELEEFIRKYHNNGWQIAIHTQGDAAITDVLDVYEKLDDELDYSDSRHRLEHCLLMPIDQLVRLKKLGMTPSYHINHLLFYGDALKQHVVGKERAKRLLPLQSTLQEGLKLSLHADQPMFKSEPLRLIQTAVQRETRTGQTINEEQQISIEDALKAMTIDAAWQIHKEDKLGSLSEGKYADFIILDRNPLKVEVSELHTINCLETYVAGNRVVTEE